MDKKPQHPSTYIEQRTGQNHLHWFHLLVIVSNATSEKDESEIVWFHINTEAHLHAG